MASALIDRNLYAIEQPPATGCSIILCCHNSTNRLYETLRALSALIIPVQLPVEILLIDNASTDDTGQYALDTWKRFASGIPMRVINEPKPGLMHARRTGIREARYELLLFCDDDNLLSGDYLLIAQKHFSNNTSLAALGGFGIPVFEKDPPGWFASFSSAYAIGSQSITGECGRTLNLYGAGLVVRRAALEHLYSEGYQPILTGRQGKLITGSEDTEMTYALVIAGYSLGYDDQMKFRHMLPSSRLTKPYLEKLILSSATDGPVRNLYHAYVTKRVIPSLMKYWPIHLAVALFRLPKYMVKPPKPGFRRLYFRWNIRYMQSLFSFRRGYRNARKNIHAIPRITFPVHAEAHPYQPQPQQVA